MKDLITQAVEDKTRKLLKKAKKKTVRVIDESDLKDVFGIDMEDLVAPHKKRAKAPKRTQKKPLIRAPKKAKDKPTTGKSGAKRATKMVSPKTKSQSPFDTVVGIVRRSRKDVTVAIIREKTGFDDQQIRNFIYKAKRQGRIKNKTRGVYVSS